MLASGTSKSHKNAVPMALEIRRKGNAFILRG